MTVLYFPSLIIPGYESLSVETREAFESSPSGKLFIQLVENLSLELENLEANAHWWQKFNGTAEKRKQEFQEKMELQKNEFIAKILRTNEYKTIISCLTQKMLQKEIMEISFLTQEQQELLSQSDFAQSLHANITQIDQQLREEHLHLENMSVWDQIGPLGQSQNELINDLQIKREEIINKWNAQFKERSDMDFFKKAIEKNKELIRQEHIARQALLLEEHAVALSLFFPLLNYRKFIAEEPIINQLRNKYKHENGDYTEDPDKVDEEQLTDLLYHCMRQVSQVEIDFMALDLFNKEQAKRMANAVLNAFSGKSTLNIDIWFKEYEANLRHYIVEQLKLVNNKQWKLKENGLKEDLYSSLSFLWKNPAVDKANEFISKLADAHGFIQATGFSTQNENSFLAILDMYNYARFHEQISETRSILLSLLSPFYPLLNEYKDIALYEKNNYWKLFRTVMPIVITVAFIILVASYLVPLFLPELAFFAAFIPSLIVGLGLASEYVATKNTIYNFLREQFYGGIFEIPEFQVNVRMLKSFGTEENAQKVRAFYIDELKHCDELEINYSSKHEQGILSQVDIDQRKANKEKRQHLCLEWYDIHSNKDLSYEQAPVIVLSRLQQASEQEYQELQERIQEELDAIGQSITEVATDIKTTIINHNKMPVHEEGSGREATVIKANYRYGLFSRPQCLKTKVHLEYLDQLSEQINKQRIAVAI